MKDRSCELNIVPRRETFAILREDYSIDKLVWVLGGLPQEFGQMQLERFAEERDVSNWTVEYMIGATWRMDFGRIRQIKDALSEL